MSDTNASGWMVERGIGEDRALLIENGEPIAAKMLWHGELRAGEIVTARLASKRTGTARGIAIAPDTKEILVDHLPPGLTEGQDIQLVVTRAPIAERGRLKQAQGRVCDSAVTSGQVFHEATQVRRFPTGMWDEIWSAASDGQIGFASGSLLFNVTPAMTLIDIDGDLQPRELALAAVPAIARWLRLFDVGGSIGIDFPTLERKADRKAVDTALQRALADWPHERTAMNGFGFVQIVARLEGPSLLHRFANSRAEAAARMAVRRGELPEGPGVTLLTVHPALKAKLQPAWLDELVRRTGRPTRVDTSPGLAIEAAAAQIIPHEH